MPGKYCMIYFFLLAHFISCRNKEPGQQNQMPPAAEGREITLNYATRFSITEFSSHKELKVIAPWPGSIDTFTYVLTYQGKENASPVPGNLQARVILPLKNLVCFSTTHLPYLEMLGETDVLTGFPTTSYISSDIFRDRVQAGKIRDLGPSNEINLEKLLDLNPDLIIAFSMNNDLSMIRKSSKPGSPWYSTPITWRIIRWAGLNG